MLSPKRQSGFTLIELLVVALLLGIFASALIPEASPTDAHRVELAAQEYADAARFARSESIRTGVPHGYYSVVTQNLVQVFHSNTGTVPPTFVADIYHPVQKQLYTIDWDSHPIIHGVSLQSASTSFRGTCPSPERIAYQPTGSAVCAEDMTVVLEDASIDLVLGNQRLTVVLDGITGRVSVQ